ncbi:hypothetical protein CkaCkLH20_02954 [Colletotrichum karsti]|uniref:Uncharacterized protein n=1 Tax=Colletotrichum karsti TaxID=1095194 RepID=A0A9P6IF59_9PEZI|nr:uncharacterized protein CkaCkLH20_02954 [Colletotrichum karsti]KAF9879411.1 hypothetical protein CkaCkLH20_02954 [Colletotrichum karsti]
MNTTRSQYVIRTLQRLPSPASTTVTGPAQLARHSSTLRESSNRSTRDTSNRFSSESPRSTRRESSKRPPRDSFNRPSAEAPRAFPDQASSTPRVNKLTQQFLERLDIGWPMTKNIYQRIPIPQNMAAAQYFVCKFSLDHVMEQYDAADFVMQTHEENPPAVMHGYTYEKKKKNEPVWQWYTGVHKFGKAGIVIRSQARFIKAMRTALFVQGYDKYGRKLPSNPGGPDLRGTFHFHVNLPQEFCTQVTMTEVQEAVNYCLDYFLHKSQWTGGKFQPSMDLKKSLQSRWASKKEMSKPDPSLRGLVYRPWLRKKDMIGGPRPKVEDVLPRPEDVPPMSSVQGKPSLEQSPQPPPKETPEKLESAESTEVPKKWSFPEIKRTKTLTWKRPQDVPPVSNVQEKPPLEQPPQPQKETSEKLQSAESTEAPKKWSFPEIKRTKTLTWKRKDPSS